LQCSAILASGKPCSRAAAPDAELCRFHASLEARHQARGFYTTRLSAREHGLLALAAQLEGVDAEIAVLRVLIRRVVTAGDLKAARYGIDTLCRTLKTRHDLDDRATGTLATSLGRVLDSLGRDVEVAL
jgi:hypothetical protein